MMNRKKVLLVSIILILLVVLIGIFAYYYLNKEKRLEVVGASSNKMALEEEIVSEVKEDVISVAQDTTIDESLKPGEDVVEFEGKEVKIPKSKVASANSSEDGERNRKKGGASVSQDQANNMFENVGQKSMGIDVSAHQGSINWAQVRASGVEFAMIRCGFRGQTAGSIYEDAYFRTNVAGATANGIKVGIYFYSTAVNEQEALEEAAWVVKQISTYRITYPVVYDFEDFGRYRCANVGGAQATSNALTFLNFVRANGYEPMLYANKNDITTRFSRGSFNCKFWLAHYTTQTDYSGSFNMWQYTSQGSVPGIAGNVDMNIAYFNYGTTAPAKHTHNFSELVKGSLKDATCTANGSKVLRCSCGDTETQTIPALGHQFGAWKTVKPATTEEEGLKERVCSRCQYKESQKIDKLKDENNNNNTSHTHDYSIVVSEKKATCTEKGNQVLKCSLCDETKEIELPVTAHTPSDWIIEKEATSIENGLKYKKCTVCDTRLEDAIIPATGEVENQVPDNSVTTE